MKWGYKISFFNKHYLEWMYNQKMGGYIAKNIIGPLREPNNKLYLLL